MNKDAPGNLLCQGTQVGPKRPTWATPRTCYLGRPGGDGIHFLGPLAGKVLRVSPPMTMTVAEAHDSLGLLQEMVEKLAK